MRRKRIAVYTAAIILFLISGILVPYGIRWVSRFVSGQIRRSLPIRGETEPVFPSRKGETEGYRILTAETENEIPEDEREKDSKKTYGTKTLVGASEYKSKNSPMVKGSEEELDDFLFDRKESFVNAVLNHLYALYGDRYLVEEIRLVRKISEENAVAVYEIELTLQEGELRGYFLTMCSYDRNEDVYTVYQTKDAPRTPGT